MATPAREHRGPAAPDRPDRAVWLMIAVLAILAIAFAVAGSLLIME